MFLSKNLRHVIPPNPFLVNPTIEDVIRAGRFLLGGKTEAPPLPVTLFSVTGKSGATRLAVGNGKILNYRLAFLYVPDAAAESPFLKELLSSVAGPFMAFAAESLLPGLSIIQRSMLETYVHEKIFPEADPYRELAEGLEKNGVTVMPFVRLIGTEAERNVLKPRSGNPVTLTFGDEKEAMSLGFYGIHPDAATQLVARRLAVEKGQMFWHVINELVFRPVFIRAIENKLTLGQLQTELEAVDKTPLLQLAPRLCQRQLELLSPMLPAYRQLPAYDVWIQELEACAAGDGMRLPGPQFYVGNRWVM